MFLFIQVSCTKNDKYVNLFLGSSGDHGQVTPGATVPFGMISVCPDSDPGQHGGYDYAVPTISGISINRISGVGCDGTGGNIRIKPALPDVNLSIDKSTEKAVPGYYEAKLNNGVKIELTATNNVALECYTFPKNSDKLLFIDFASSFDQRNISCFYELVNENTIEGYVISPTACARGSYKIWFELKTDHSFQIKDAQKDNLLISFDHSTHKVEVRIAISPLDQITANNEARQVDQKSFSQIQKQAKRVWNEKLNKIDVTGGNKDLKTIFYTSIYRIYLSPMNVTSYDGRYLGTDGEIYKAEGYQYYSSWSMWDTFRTKFPLLILLEREVMQDIARSVLDLYKTGKESWATQFESTPTVRTEHSQIMLLDAYLKGIENIDFSVAYDAMKNEADNLPMNSPDQRIESTYDLWAMAKIAEIMEQLSDADHYNALADSIFEESWKRDFMHITSDFDKMKGNGLYQGTRWQYRWAAPQYIHKMIEWVGMSELEKQLTYFFDNHLYNQGNEPDIHTPYLFNLLGSPHKSQQVVYDLITKDMIHKYGGNAAFPAPFYGRAFRNHVEGYLPEMDEDDGTMSAWFIFGAVGMYPLVIGSDKYELTAPLFDKIKIQTGEKTIRIRTRNRKTTDQFTKSILIDGKKIEGRQITHKALLDARELIFTY